MGKWYKEMINKTNEKLRDHQGFKKDDGFPESPEDKKLNQKLAPVGTSTSIAPRKKPASTITMDWIKDAKAKLKE